jgi:DMSO/TMAO reductase YedYZ molybdopterin-dependent catalytic subunit
MISPMSTEDRFKALLGDAPGTLLAGIKEKLVRAKEKMAREKRHISDEAEPADDPPVANPYRTADGKRRLPPGQNTVKKWPVLDLGVQPNIPKDRWNLTVNGAVDNPAPGLRRAVAAGDDGYGDGVPSGPDHLRRADHCPRRHHAD